LKFSSLLIERGPKMPQVCRSPQGNFTRCHPLGQPRRKCS
jgi:hypothetical protein